MRQVWYHGGCWDGFGAAWAFNRLQGPARFVAVNYGEQPPSHGLDDEVFILDFSYPPEVMLRLKAGVKSLLVIDHHNSAEEAVRAVGGIFDSSHSGAVLAWCHFTPDMPVPWLLRYVEDRDLWAWKLPNSKSVQWLIRSLRPTFEAWDEMHALFEKEDSVALSNRARHVRDFVETQIASEMVKAWPQELGGHKCMVLNATLLTSDICDALIQDGAKVAAYFTVGRDGRRRWGIRSKNGEALEIATAMGGGGHPNAAGFIDPLTP